MKCRTLIFALTALLVGGRHVFADAKPLAPGYGALGFPAPKPGSYRLPALGQASDGKVLDSEGRPDSLYRLMQDGQASGKIIVLSFIYSTCSDVNGCPLATAVLHKLKSRLEREPGLTDRVRLLTLSFNPAYDTPKRMRDYGRAFQGGRLDWRFLTTASEQDLSPILRGYRLEVEKVLSDGNHFTNTFNHPLRVFLIDGTRQIRNIYNTELLHPDTLLSDIKTLLQPRTAPPSIPVSQDQTAVYTAGDNKSNYGSAAYQTRSVALASRQGHQADLLKSLRQPPLGLPAVPVPDANPVTASKIALGRKLFFDRRLSINATFSCAMCHIPEQGFTSNEMATAVGVEGRTVRRNSPTLYNVAYAETLFHDGRESTLEQQVWAPLLAHNEMANPSIGFVIDTIRQSADYKGLFEQAFGKPPGMETIGMAIASYERTLNSANSPFDRWYFGKEQDTLPGEARHGFELFSGKGGCSQCHLIDRRYALFTDNRLHNTGIGFQEAMLGKRDATANKVQVAPGVFREVPKEVVESVSEPKANDLGRYEITQKPEDRWRYKTPTLRNVGLTAPYMHNGSLATLRDVVEFYNTGGFANENLDPLIKPLGLNEDEIKALTEFLANLTGDNTKELISDAFAAPIGDNE